MSEQLYNECRDGTLEGVAKQLALGVDVNGDAGKALLIACRDERPRTALVSLLLKHGANPGRSHLTAVCRHDKTPDRAILLVDAGVCVDGLMAIAAEQGSVALVQLLIDKGAKIDGIDAACRNGHVDVVRLLLDHGARPVEGDFAPPVQALLASYGLAAEPMTPPELPGVHPVAAMLHRQPQAWLRLRLAKRHVFLLRKKGWYIES